MKRSVHIIAAPVFFLNRPIKSLIRQSIHCLEVPSPTSTMPGTSPVHADSISYGIWERIAFYAVASEETFLGPPSEICSMLLISRSVYHQISYRRNTHLYARIFGFKFDLAAPTRRLSERWRTTACLASELIKRFQALRRIKSRQLHVEDLWTAYLMMLESDGRNEAQLLNYAHLEEYLKSLIVYRTNSQAQDLMWFKNPVVDSLVVWLLWVTSERGSIRCEDSQLRHSIIGILHSLIITGYQHSSVYAPDVFFTLPLCSGSDASFARALQVPRSEIIHYSHRLQLAAPVIAPAAIMALVVRADSVQDLTNVPRVSHDLPRNRAEAIAQGHNGPTAADIFDFHLNNRIHIVDRCQPVLDTRFIEDLDVDDESDTAASCEVNTGSKRHDQDWYRLVACHDPWVGDMPLRGVVYGLGSMAGSWAGRLIEVDLELLTSLTTGHQANPSHSTISVRHRPLYWQLQEHHCLSPNEPVSLGVDDNFLDDFLNAWLPRGVTFTHLGDAVEVYDPLTGRTARYETVIPRSAALYSKTEKLSRSWICDESDGVIADNVPELASGLGNPDISIGPSLSIDDDDEYCDTVSHLSSGVSDILITGKTGELYGDAWGHYTIYGRVRPWDGLTALLRIPSDPSEDHLGKWIFKGYLHDQNFVGRWRETSTPMDSIGYQGGFVVYKTDDEDKSE
ncbi:hypothetical protein BDZ97DRAFT_1051779 [Flammula alnicola]|nr:hypothetical protein BDZ97DRAFT_1051779 [Flammula alnicola]